VSGSYPAPEEALKRWGGLLVLGAPSHGAQAIFTPAPDPPFVLYGE
jgi:hypothetical protein